MYIVNKRMHTSYMEMDYIGGWVNIYMLPIQDLEDKKKTMVETYRRFLCIRPFEIYVVFWKNLLCLLPVR